MTKIKRFLVAAAVAGTTALAPLPAEAFFGMMSAMMGGGWGGWGYPYYGYPYAGYPLVASAPVVVTQPVTTAAK